jgi:hypothetical protein
MYRVIPYRVIWAALIGAAFLLGACDSGPSPFQRQAARPGADRSVPASNALPPAPSRSGYDGAIAPENDTQGAKVGALVAHDGGQQAQREKEDKERAKLEAARAKQREEERQQRAPSSAQMPAEQPAAAAVTPVDETKTEAKTQ